MTSVNESFTAVLKSSGHSLTRVRHKVFEALDKQEPQTMRELIAALPTIDRASVYRTIELFEKLGIVGRLQIGWKYKLELTDRFHPHHHHLSCTQCGVIIPLHEHHPLEAEIVRLAQTHQFTASTHQIEIQGLCKNCQKI